MNLKSAELVRVDGPLGAAIELLRAVNTAVYASSISGQSLE